jgi:glycosyltransferase involved in cell wall biosynthesis
VSANTTTPFKLTFICTEGDDDQIAACRSTAADVLVVEGGASEYPRKMNHGYRVTSHPYLLLAADDVDFQPGWDGAALAVAEQSDKSVIGLNDLLNRNVMDGHFSTIPLVRRSYVTEQGGSLDGPGVLLHEGYDHNFVDRELCALAQARNEWAFAPDAKIRHVHKGRHADATYRKGADHFQADHELFMQRAKEWGNVGLMPQELRFQRRAGRRGLNTRHPPAERMSVSILVATYGSTEWRDLALSRAVPSAEQQGVDVVVVHEKKGTVASSRNAAAAQAKGDWLCFLDGDDQLAPGYVQAVNRIHIRNPDPLHLYTPAVSYVYDGRRKPPRFWPECNLDTANWMVIGTLIHKDVFEAIGGFHELPHGLEDWSVWGRAARYGCVPVKVPRAVYVAHHNPESKHHQLRLDKAEYGVWYEKAKAGIAAQETLA